MLAVLRAVSTIMRCKVSIFVDGGGSIVAAAGR